MEKTYSNASNARRAAKSANLVDFTICKEGDQFKIVVAAPEPAKAPKVARKAKPAKVTIAKKKAPRKAVARIDRSPSTKPGTKGAQLLEMVTQGATISELQGALGWQPHTVRAALSRFGTAGYSITRTKVGSKDEGFESHYKIAA